MTQKANSDFVLSGVFTREQLIAKLGMKENTKFNAWLKGQQKIGHNFRPLKAALRHFRDGKTVIILEAWWHDFLVRNAQDIAEDDTGESDFED